MKSDKYKGCLIGGAVGDALGYPIEFTDDIQLFNKYGKNGVTEYILNNGVAEISDDTQMTLFTANGLLLCRFNNKSDNTNEQYLKYVSLCYRDWLKTQYRESLNLDTDTATYSWLNRIPEINHSREPGRTCINSLLHKQLGSIANPLNYSKGCGGVMRVAPVGLFFNNEYSLEKTDILGAEIAALTHGHELGYIPAAMLVHIVHLLAHTDGISMLEAVNDALKTISRLFCHSLHISELIDLINNAKLLALDANICEHDAITQLGQGWVAEETLAIAIYCSLKHENEFAKAIISSVNHSGDSDSTGSVTGNIVGAYLGASHIPKKYTQKLELKNIISEMAYDLCFSLGNSSAEKKLKEKYVINTDFDIRRNT